MTRPTRVGHHPAATVCHLLKRAAALAKLPSVSQHDPFPLNVIPDAIEVGRMKLEQNSLYAFGVTLVDHDRLQCESRFEGLVHALQQIGADKIAMTKGLGGNFLIERCHSLIQPESDRPIAIPQNWIDLQVQAALASRSLHLRWLSPLCASLPKRYQKDGKKAGFFDSQRFPITDLGNRLLRRLSESFKAIEPFAVHASDLKVIDPPNLSRLHWIKWQYGGVNPDQHRKHSRENKSASSRQQIGRLFGVMGRMTIDVRNPKMVRALVLGQYAHIGERINFGLGRYTIENVQSALPANVPHNLRAYRGIELTDIAFAGPAMENEAHRLNVPIGRVRDEADEIARGTFHPRPADKFLLPGEKPRLISVPARPERVLQRAIYEQLYPVIDRFLSDSCIAYRKGMGRNNATVRLEKAFHEGWRWALKADFHHFFDSVEHSLLKDKLEVFVQDDAMIDLLMSWVESGAPQPGRGLPTGAVISPLLANLFLQQFDAAVQHDGGRLIRYADDFVLLFRDPSKGRAVWDRANKLAQELHLHLNDKKTKLVELQNTPFDFLGFRFFSEKGWQFRGDGLTQIEDLKWHQAPKERDVATRKVLPGEQGLEPSRSGSWIVGPHIEWIGIEGQDVVCRSRSRGTEDRFLRRRVRELIVLGPATLDHSLFRNRDGTPMQLLIADDIGRWTCSITDAPPMELAALVKAQVDLSNDSERNLHLARRIVAAKLNNHATLTVAYPARSPSGSLSGKLQELAQAAMKAEDISKLMGIEGAGAAAWYGEFERRISSKFKFERRVHPNATDPVNVMLNIAQTLLHRLISLTLVREGFAPSIGILHRPGPGHAALASDLQEVFRHLMDRVVIEATYVISPGEFHETGKETFFLRMEAGAYRTLVASVFKMLSTTCVMRTQQAAKPYRHHIATLARSLHHHLLNSDAHFKIFEHIA